MIDVNEQYIAELLIPISSINLDEIYRALLSIVSDLEGNPEESSGNKRLSYAVSLAQITISMKNKKFHNLSDKEHQILKSPTHMSKILNLTFDDEDFISSFKTSLNEVFRGIDYVAN